MPDWDPSVYLKFAAERTQPSVDLINRIELTAPDDILDIGCGPGNSTAQLKSRYPNAFVTGIDNSPDMITAARKKHKDMSFVLCDASSGLRQLNRKFDIVFSNACIQWVPDHRRLIPEMLSLLKPDGVLAVQVPIHYTEPIHIIIGETVRSERWKVYFSSPEIFHTLRPREYFELLGGCSADFSMWETVYYHRMRSCGDIIEWYRGSGLRPYLSVLSESERKEFEADILKRLEDEYPVCSNGEIIFKFPRLFFTARKQTEQ